MTHGTTFGDTVCDQGLNSAWRNYPRHVIMRSAPACLQGILRKVTEDLAMTSSSDDGRKQPGARLLVVEDEPNILELLSASLRYAGFDVVTAAAGTEAVQAAQRHRPDLIVLDVMLPDMDGFDVIRRLRGGGTRIPVVFLTARDAMEDKVRGLTLGGDDYVTKPFSLEEVIARIRAVLRRTRGDGAEPTPRLKFADLVFAAVTRRRRTASARVPTLQVRVPAPHRNSGGCLC